MAKQLHLWLCICSAAILVKITQSANILAMFPSVWKSHYLYGRRLMENYATQFNHTVTFISPYKSEAEHQTNVREIRVPGLEDNWSEMGLSFNVEHVRQKSVMERYTRLIYAGTSNVDLLLNDHQVQRLLQSGETFDLLVVDLFLSEALLGLSHFYQIPTVVVSPTGANTWLNHMTGNPQNSALDPSNFLPYSERMNIWERSLNTLMSIFERLTYNFFHMISQQAIYLRHFQTLCQRNGNEAALPHHRELTKNLSLVLVNSHPLVQYPRAYLPNMIEVGGAHLSLNASELQLPEHMEKFISGAPRGVLYISLGANLRTSDLAREKLDTFLHVFESLHDMRVLLKWELHTFDYHLPANVFLSDWFPQEAVLAHKNVKIFISSAGPMSILEAIYHKTPLLTLPINPEQEVAAHRMQQAGCAAILPFDSFTYDELLHTINGMLRNASYAEHIEKFHDLLSLENAMEPRWLKAVNYIELILRKGGAAHLRSHANELGFFSTVLLDVLLILLLGMCCIIAVPFCVTCCILRKSYYSHLTSLSYGVPKTGCEAIGAAVSETVGTAEVISKRRSSASASSSSSSYSPTRTPNTSCRAPRLNAFDLDG